MAKEFQNEATERIQAALKTGAVELDLSGLDLTEVPEEIAHLTKLRMLDLSYNELTSLPDVIAQLTNLQALDIDNNQLTSLPDAIAQLTNLQRLDLSDNQLMNLPDAIGQLANLQALTLSNNQLTSLPDAIGQLANLQALILDHNKLTNLPDTIGKLTNLENLFLHVNQLISLPETNTHLANLETFFLDNNELTKLPKTIALFTNLKELDLSNNKLANLPEEVKQLTQLEKLYLHGNDKLNLPREILGPTWQEVNRKSETPARSSDILDYYFRARQGEKRPLNEAKLILVGYGDVGKTSLVNRLVKNTFDKDSPKTEGIQITQWPIQINGAENIRLNIWDFGGQEIMHATHQFFLTQRSLYILVLNGRQGHEDADAEYWLNLIESFGDESPVLIILNKIKDHPFDLNRRALRQKFLNIVDFIETDCKTSYGIKKLRQTIERETDRLKHLRDAFPASWFGIKDQIATMPENFISFERYRTLCTDQGETDPTAQERLSTYLHNLGIILNYKDDLRLRDTHVLNPQWVTKGIYTILNAKKLAQNKGELNVCDFAAILDPQDYPPERHAYLFELMRKFELCVRFPEPEGRYLIPQLLDKQQPPEADDFPPAECLNFQYHYPTLPEGLLPRFIVRTHTLSVGHPRWRTGAILQFDGDTALVKADIQDKKVYISVKGASSGRRRLLAVIRSDFERIHSDFSFKPEEIVPVPNHPNVLIPYKKLRIMEKKNISTLQEVTDEDVLTLNVADLLNGVDLEGTRKPETMKDLNKKSLRLFYSYSHKDEALRDELETHLKLLQRQGLIQPWHDRRIAPGQEWKDEIDTNLERADIILLLVSADFIASDYCYDIEMKRALERYEAKEAEVIPVIIRDCSWQSAPFGKLQALPKDAKAVNNTKSWDSRDAAWTDVERGIATVIRRWKGDRHL
jgi:internalin A